MTIPTEALVSIEYSQEILQIHRDYEAFQKALSTWTGAKAMFVRRVLEWRVDEHKAPRLFTFLEGVTLHKMDNPRFLQDFYMFLNQEQRVVVEWFDDNGTECPQNNIHSRPRLCFTGEDGAPDWAVILTVMDQYDHRMDEYQAWLDRNDDDPKEGD